MPNWVKNKITIIDDDYLKIIKSVINKDEELDFNKLIPMPKSLEISSGTTSDTCARLYVNSFMEDCEAFAKYLKLYKQGDFHRDWKMSEEEIQEDFKLLISQDERPNCTDNFKTKADVYSRGKQVLDNIGKYGFKDWYDWSIANWGTKWNACESFVENNSIYFDTAWDPVPIIVEKLSKKFPTAKIHYDYAEEQLCVCCGEMDFENGQIVNMQKFEFGSKEAYDKAFELWGGKEFFKYDKKTKTYKFKDNQSDEGME